jgi:hypothetical protein
MLYIVKQYQLTLMVMVHIVNGMYCHPNGDIDWLLLSLHYPGI